MPTGDIRKLERYPGLQKAFMIEDEMAGKVVGWPAPIEEPEGIPD
jgi:hypothetical protein